MTVFYLNDLIARKAIRAYVGKKGSAPLVATIEQVCSDVGCTGADVMLQIHELIYQGAASLDLFTIDADEPYIALTITPADVAAQLNSGVKL